MAHRVTRPLEGTPDDPGDAATAPGAGTATGIPDAPAAAAAKAPAAAGTTMPDAPAADAPGADRRKGDKGRRILDAAIEVFAEKGFFNATVAEVARRAGVADGTIYLYYKGKDDLLIRLFEEIMANINSTLRRAIAGTEGAADRLRAVAEAQAELVIETPAIAEVICVELRQSSKFMKEYDNPGFRDYLAILAEVIAEGQQSGELATGPGAQVAARSFFGALDELHLSWCLARKHHFDLKEASREITEIFVRGLLTNPPPKRSTE